MEIRRLSESDDRNAVSRIYEESWKWAYKGIIPQDYLDSIPSGKWAAGLDTAGRSSLVMLENKEFIGTSSFCSSRFPEFEGMGEIVSIYLLPEFAGKGYGRQLLDAVIGELSDMGFDEVFLWVLEENMRARGFYEKAGFTANGKFLEDNIGGKDLREIMYTYHIH